MSTEALLLDTHAWLWLGDGTEGRIADKALERIDAAGRGSRVHVSAISIWEIGVLVAKRRISLAVTLDEWIEASLTQARLQFLSLDAQTALESTRLPGAMHGDPADRFLVATARVRGLRIVTADQKILAYGEAGNVRTLGL